MTLRETLIEAMEQEVHGGAWLAEAQDASLVVHYDSQVEFHGKGYIDLRALADLVIGVLEEVDYGH